MSAKMEGNGILFVCVIFILFAEFQSQSIDLPTVELPAGRVLSIAKKKCLQNDPDGKSSQVQIALMELQVCLVEYEYPQAQAAKNDSDPSVLQNELCVNIRNYNYQCLTTFSEQIRPCLDPEEQYLPEFLQNAYNDIFNSLCEDGETIFLSLLSSFINGTCSDIPEDNLFNNCVETSKLMKDINNSDYMVITKKQLCQDIEMVSTCASTELRKHCESGTYYIDIISKIFLNLCGDAAGNEI